MLLRLVLTVQRSCLNQPLGSCVDNSVATLTVGSDVMMVMADMTQGAYQQSREPRSPSVEKTSPTSTRGTKLSLFSRSAVKAESACGKPPVSRLGMEMRLSW